MRPDEIGTIASAIARLLQPEQVSGRDRTPGSGPAKRKTRRPRSRRQDFRPLASEIGAAMRSRSAVKRRRARADFDRMVALIASEVIARVTPDRQRQDLPLQPVEI